MTVAQPKVLCFGEVLWDCFADTRYIGGAPVNVAYHLTQLGATAWPVSRVGRDVDGEAIIAQLDAWSLPLELLGVMAEKPTGTVKVTVTNGEPSFDIANDVAWDYIDVPIPLPKVCRSANAVVFGSLAQRSRGNRAMLQALLDAVPDALKVFDVNLRPPFDSLPRVRAGMADADLIKLTEAEADLLVGEKMTNIELSARALSERTQCAKVCITAGSRGAGYLQGDQWYWVDAIPVQVSDTVGAGDAFLAALVNGLLTAPDAPGEALDKAARLAAFVAGSDGATPQYDSENVL